RGSRAPASAIEEDAKNSSETTLTNKKLYFLTLFSEYESLKNFSPDFSGPSVSICPNFHTGLLQHKERYFSTKTVGANKKFTYDSHQFNDQMYLAAHPELLLPLSKDDLNPKVVDVIKSSTDPISDSSINELVHKALDIHLAKTYSEIRELCEFGSSDNYFIYENLITHIKNNKFDADNKNMNTLLKTTLFSNIALMNSIEKHESASASRSIASEGSDFKKASYTSEVMARLNVSWANQYFDYIKKSN
ncbi:MAG: hypothetical protein Q7U04_10890, partial [Bacteriovorax sp.]|nr:hypothetical protein [Bacteriovorax sp.]